MSVENNLYGRINKTSDDCWEFTGALRNGYGAIKIKNKIYGAHRVSYELNYGEIPDDLLVCHKCDNRKCINPEHLFLGLYSDNMQDCKNKRRHVRDIGRTFKDGNYPNNTTISLENALLIKEKVLARGKKSLITLSKELNVSYQYLRDISCNRILKNR